MLQTFAEYWNTEGSRVFAHSHEARARHAFFAGRKGLIEPAKELPIIDIEVEILAPVVLLLHDRE